MQFLECTQNLTTPIKSMIMSAPDIPKNASVPQEPTHSILKFFSFL